MKRKLSLKKYFLAFILTVVVFSLGAVVGILLENARLADTKQITLNEKVNLQSLQLQQKYIESGIGNCNALNEILEANMDELARKLGVIVDYEKRAFLNEEEFNLQLRDYFLTEMQFLLVSQDIDKQCQKDNVKILYFYDESTFDTQGRVLDYLRNRFDGKVLVFSFNSAFEEEPMIRTLLASYGITQYPSVVVENRVFQGHTEVERLLGEICKEFRRMGKSVEECQG